MSIDPEFYNKLVKSQLTNAQMGLLFYSSITKYTDDSQGEFAKRLDSSNIFENLPKSYCPKKELLIFYPKTTFKYVD